MVDKRVPGGLIMHNIRDEIVQIKIQEPAATPDANLIGQVIQE